MAPKKNPLTLNTLQLKTLTLLQELARLPALPGPKEDAAGGAHRRLRLAFVGDMYGAAHQDAARYLCQRILPRVRRVERRVMGTVVESAEASGEPPPHGGARAKRVSRPRRVAPRPGPKSRRAAAKRSR